MSAMARMHTVDEDVIAGSAPDEELGGANKKRRVSGTLYLKQISLELCFGCATYGLEGGTHTDLGSVRAMPKEQGQVQW